MRCSTRPTAAGCRSVRCWCRESIRPGTPVTLIRGGKVVGHGEVDQLVTRNVPRAGDIAAVLNAEADFAEYSVSVTANETLVVQTVTRQVVGAWHGFVRLSGAGLAEAVVVRGVFDFFIKIDGVLHMVLRDGKAGTGMWRYSVYRLIEGQAPKRVYVDGSWST